MKKLILALVVVLAVGQTSVVAMAHGHSGSKYAVCKVKNCNITKVHKHNGKYYCGHYAGDGHARHNGSHH